MKKLPIFVVNHRIVVLKTFLGKVRKYFDCLRYNISGEAIETKESINLRSEINLLIGRVELYVSESNTSDVYHYRAPPVVGGYAQTIPLIQNIFCLTSYRIQPQTLYDVIERAISDYTDDKPYALIRTINPLYWITVLIQRIAQLPFVLLNASGFNGNKIALSTAGRLVTLFINLVLGAITALSGVVTIFAALGKVDLLTSLVTFK
jgi:hypothetical protein